MGPESQRWRKPARSPSPLELGGRRLVGAPASLSALGVLDAGRRPDEDQAAHELGAGQRGVEGEAGAEGVAEEVERGVGRLAEQPSALLQVGGDPGGPGVAGEVHPHEGAPSASWRPNGPTISRSG